MNVVNQTGRDVSDIIPQVEKDIRLRGYDPADCDIWISPCAETGVAAHIYGIDIGHQGFYYPWPSSPRVEV